MSFASAMQQSKWLLYFFAFSWGISGLVLLAHDTKPELATIIVFGVALFFAWSGKTTAFWGRLGGLGFLFAMGIFVFCFGPAFGQPRTPGVLLVCVASAFYLYHLIKLRPTKS